MLMLFVPLVLGPIQLHTEAPIVREICGDQTRDEID